MPGAVPGSYRAHRACGTVLCRLMRGSPLSSRRVLPLKAREVLPSLRKVQRYKRGGNAVHWGDLALLTAPFPLGGEGKESGEDLLRSQRRVVRHLLKGLGEAILPKKLPFVPRSARPFREVPAVPAEGGRVVLQRVTTRGGATVLAPVPEVTAMCLPGRAGSSLVHKLRYGRVAVRLGPRNEGKRSFIGDNAARIICWALQGPPPQEISWSKAVVGHLCGCPSCVCPAHLRWMTRSQDAACRQWHKLHGRGEQRVWKE
jgi:hypothetical protein